LISQLYKIGLEKFLSSNIPEIFLLPLLSRIPEEKKTDVVREVVSKLKKSVTKENSQNTLQLVENEQKKREFLKSLT